MVIFDIARQNKTMEALKNGTLGCINKQNQLPLKKKSKRVGETDIQ